MSRGGARKGTGNSYLPENLKRNNYTIKLPQHLIDWLRTHKNQSRMIESALNKIKFDDPEFKECFWECPGCKKIMSDQEIKQSWEKFRCLKCNSKFSDFIYRKKK